MTQLECLYLGENRISDITPLGNLENLTRLSVPLNLISDINPIKVLTNLTWLTVYGNKLPALFGKHAESLKKANPELHITFNSPEGLTTTPW
jgi:Leucine-rich repeat (LRR) protein